MADCDWRSGIEQAYQVVLNHRSKEDTEVFHTEVLHTGQATGIATDSRRCLRAVPSWLFKKHFARQALNGTDGGAHTRRKDKVVAYNHQSFSTYQPTRNQLIAILLLCVVSINDQFVPPTNRPTLVLSGEERILTVSDTQLHFDSCGDMCAAIESISRAISENAAYTLVHSRSFLCSL